MYPLDLSRCLQILQNLPETYITDFILIQQEREGCLQNMI